MDNLQFENFRLNFSSCFRAFSKINVHGAWFVSSLQINVTGMSSHTCSKIMSCISVKLPTNNFRIVWSKNPRNPSDVAALRWWIRL